MKTLWVPLHPKVFLSLTPPSTLSLPGVTICEGNKYGSKMDERVTKVH